MSCKTVITCDFCDATITGDPCYATPLGAAFDMKRGTIYGCSKEHLALALAKEFGVPIAPPSNAISEMVEAWANPANNVTSAERAQYTATIELQRKRIAELEKDGEEKAVIAHACIVSLEKRLADVSVPPTVDGKTPGEVLILAQHGLRPFQVSREMVESAEHAAGAVLRAFGQPSQTTTNGVEVLRRVRERIAKDPYADVRAMRYLDEEIAMLKGAKLAPTAEHGHNLERCGNCSGSGVVASDELHMAMQAVPCGACNGTGKWGRS